MKILIFLLIVVVVLQTSSACFCLYQNGGCKIYVPAKSGNSCFCILQKEMYNCISQEKSCDDPDQPLCRRPDVSRAACEFAGGDCSGYHWGGTNLYIHQYNQPSQPPKQQPDIPIPINDQPMPVTGTDCPDDGCGDNSVRFPDGYCYPIFSSRNCKIKNHWVTFDNATRLQNGCGTTGKCTRRLCDDRRVFVGSTGLCQDMNDPVQCKGGRRLYNSAFGDSICDCPIGQFPFPNPTDNCVPLFTQGPCPGGQVVTLSHGGRLFCAPDECQSQTTVCNCSYKKSLLSLVPSDRGQCQAIGSRGSCSSDDSQFLGYDIFKRQLRCTNVKDSTSPYFSFLRERKLKKKLITDQQKLERNRKMSNGFIKTNHNQSVSVKISGITSRQGTFGIFQFPSSISPPLLSSCHTGFRNGNNQKCTNPLVSNSQAQLSSTSTVPPTFICPPNQFLKPGGQCVNNKQEASCAGPSFKFNPITRQCRAIFKKKFTLKNLTLTPVVSLLVCRF